MDKKIIWLGLILLSLSGAGYFYVYNQWPLPTGMSELVGGWKSVNGGIDAEIVFSIEDGKQSFNSYSGEYDGTPSHPMMVGCNWDYKKENLFIICPDNPALDMVFDFVLVSGSTLTLKDSGDGSIGIYERITE